MTTAPVPPPNPSEQSGGVKTPVHVLKAWVDQLGGLLGELARYLYAERFVNGRQLPREIRVRPDVLAQMEQEVIAETAVLNIATRLVGRPPIAWPRTEQGHLILGGVAVVAMSLSEIAALDAGTIKGEVVGNTEDGSTMMECLDPEAN